MVEIEKLNYDDITVVPDIITNIKSRKDCNPYDENGFLPIFASPMTSVVSIENAEKFNESKIYAVIPRSYSVCRRIHYLYNETDNFVAFSFKEAEDYILNVTEYNNDDCGENTIEIFDVRKAPTDKQFKICIDLANGHMKCLLELVAKLKEKYGERIIIMTGNVANPKTYELYEKAGVDYLRAGIGGGSLCSTSSNVSIHYPYFSLIQGLSKEKERIGGRCKIIADGNIRGYRDIQKALIYADYVMIGGLFNKAIESAGKTTYGSSYWNVRGKKIYRPITTLLTYGKVIPAEKFDSVYKKVKDGKLTVWKEEFGQSTKIAQSIVAMANKQTNVKLKTSEGLVKYQKVEYDIKGWAENETDYLRSAMSYTNSRTLEEYHNSDWVKITQIRYNN